MSSQATASPPGGQSLALPFRPRARILQLLGDELIGSARLAVFELVKNAYDADARMVRGEGRGDLRGRHQGGEADVVCIDERDAT